MSGLRVAVIGSGPAGVYAAAALSRAGNVEVDVLDRLPAPYGLVRYGVAPDHVKMKSVDVALRRILEDPPPGRGPARPSAAIDYSRRSAAAAWARSSSPSSTSRSAAAWP